MTLEVTANDPMEGLRQRKRRLERLQRDCVELAQTPTGMAARGKAKEAALYLWQLCELLGVDVESL